MAALVYLGNNANDIADFLTPFADGWSEGWRDFFRGALGVLLFIGGLALAVVTFTALTLTIGGALLREAVGEGRPAGRAR
ncbi:hypothetical protein [Nonomuraea dietziae]|uniref:hypothetical protein n=1 Tax=Nonomuraea dietziae TaxID=65515 RepID=UPI0031D65752